jgi:hypothetical protein
MKKIYGFLILLFLTTAFSFTNKVDENKMQSFQWIVGSWTMKTKNGAIMETWALLNDSTIGGESIMVRNSGSTQQLEDTRLVYRNKEYFYCSVAHGQNDEKEVKFKITSFSDNRFVSENPAHDFPRRITYQLISKDSLHAFIDGGPSMPDKKSDFYYSRNKN